MMRKCWFLVFAFAAMLGAAQRYQTSGLVIAIDAAHQSVTISNDSIPGYMDAMVMIYRVRDQKGLADLKPGAKVDFTLVVDKSASYVTGLHVRQYQSLERDPDESRRLEALDTAMRGTSPTLLRTGQPVPEFTLEDQTGASVSLGQFRGKVVAVTFIYTRCPLPDYCLRMSDNFARLQKRFRAQLNSSLVLLSISFDPEHDRPEVLAKYAAQWKAAPGWHFLTGSDDAVKEVCDLFGASFWHDGDLITHALHTVVIDRRGALVANIEGNHFTARQLGDLVEAQLKAK